ncbi:MAG: DUF4105 domain-containing protein [Cytophagales bacterium]
MYLITCGPGTELYSTFGHSAIWVLDSLSNIDEVYNFGTFDFETEGFYVKFTKGKLPYALDYSSLKTFVHSYVYENREVKAQLLNLDSLQAEKLYTSLVLNMKEENRYYAYDFFFDNCSTRLRDLLENTLDSKEIWQPSEQDKKETLRQMLNPGVKKMPWTKFGFYLSLGSVTDRIATEREQLFLPDKLFSAFERAQIKGKNLVLQSYVVYKPTETTELPRILFTPFVLVTIIWIAYIYFWKINNNKKIVVLIEYFILTVFGLTGLLLLFLWFGTEHQATKLNFNTLWASPLLLIFIFKTPFKFQKLVYWILFVLFLLFLLVGLLKIQEFHLVSYLFSCLIFLILTKKTFLQN